MGTKLVDPKAVNQLFVIHVANGSVDMEEKILHPGLLSEKESLHSFNGNELVNEFSSFSDIGINLYDREKLDSDALSHFKKTVKYHEDIHQFECGIPWCDASPPTD